MKDSSGIATVAPREEPQRRSPHSGWKRVGVS